MRAASNRLQARSCSEARVKPGPAIPPLDPLIHSLRWNREHIISRAWRSLWEWRRDNYGDRPDYLEVAPFLRYDLLANMEGWRTGALSFSAEDYANDRANPRLFGIPIRVNREARGFQWAPGRRHPSWPLV